jgi:hypothetical protein
VAFHLYDSGCGEGLASRLRLALLPPLMISTTYDYAPASGISWECHLASTPSTQQPVYDVGIVEAMKAKWFIERESG